jgi:hypothetical protein
MAKQPATPTTPCPPVPAAQTPRHRQGLDYLAQLTNAYLQTMPEPVRIAVANAAQAALSDVEAGFSDVKPPVTPGLPA